MEQMKNKENIDWYVSNFKTFESKLNGESESFFHQVRKDAIAQLEELNFPTKKNEEWKYTNISPILKYNFAPAVNTEAIKISNDEIQKHIFTGFDCCLMVFVNGIYSAELSNIKTEDGVVIDSLRNVLKTKPELVKEYIGKSAKVDNGFNAINMAYALDGAVIIIPEGKVVENPIQLLYLNGNSQVNVLSLPRNLILAGKNSQVNIIENYRGYSDNPYFTNVVSEVFVDENAIVNLHKVQNESDNAYHIEKTEVHQKRSSIFNHFSFSFGGSIVRNDVNSNLDDEGIECNYYGLYLAHNKQLVDNHTFVDHAKPNCNSNEIYKGILDDNSKGVFNGKIMVRPGAQKTNAFQSNKTVLLTDTATIDTKPQLEIFADDVKCSHGATVGHLDDSAYFYIRSRGIPDELAKSMLIRAFANDVIDAVKINELHEQLNHMIFEHLNRVEI